MPVASVGEGRKSYGPPRPGSQRRWYGTSALCSEGRPRGSGAPRWVSSREVLCLKLVLQTTARALLKRSSNGLALPAPEHVQHSVSWILA